MSQACYYRDRLGIDYESVRFNTVTDIRQIRLLVDWSLSVGRTYTFADIFLSKICKKTSPQHDLCQILLTVDRRIRQPVDLVLV